MKATKSNIKLQMFFRWPHLYMLILFLFAVLIFIENWKWGILAISLFFILLILNTIGVIQYRKYVMEHVQDLALDLTSAQKNIFFKFPIPYIFMDIHGNIRWYNPKFEELFEGKKLMNKNIHQLIPDLSVDQFPKSEGVFEKEISFQNKHYKAYSELITMDKKEEETDEYMFVVYLMDNTQNVKLKQQTIRQQTLVSLIFIDNYEEVMHSMEEVRRPLLIALIDRKLNTVASQIEGIVRKFEKDKYMLIFPYEKLKTLQDSKFEVLDQIREIHIGNELPVTLSIGIGLNGNTLNQSMEYARAAIDLALGRGGDQAVIKNVDKYSFYGGKTKEVEKSTRVKARIKAYAFKELMEEAEEVLIMGHKGPDVDSLGAAIGVYRGAKLLDKKAHIVLNEPTTSINVLYDKFIESEEYPEDLFLGNVEAIGHTGDKTLLVIVDVNRPSYLECPELLELSKNIVVFDHHRASAEFIQNAVLSYVEPYASSTCEMITEILQYMTDKVKLKPLEADALFAGIAVDTKNFAIKTGVRTFEAAAFLRRNGADSTRVRMFFQNDMESYRARASAVKDAEIFQENIAISVCPSDITNPALVAAQAADELLNISGITASFVMCHVESKILLSARSLGDINVQLIMEKLGGGGHLTVAGAQLQDATIYTAREKLKDVIKEYYKEEKKS